MSRVGSSHGIEVEISGCLLCVKIDGFENDYHIRDLRSLVERFVLEYRFSLGRLTHWLKWLDHDAHNDTLCDSSAFNYREKILLGTNNWLVLNSA